MAQMTNEEHALMDALADVSNRFAKLIDPTSSQQAAFDWAEVASKIHDLQARVMAQAAAREHPNRYRSILGGKR